jgi:hypothetical protein
VLTIHPGSRGDALISVRASDGVNAAAKADFRVMVYPAAHKLSLGEFSFGHWNASTPELIYPQNMLFLQADKADPGLHYPLLYPYHIPHDDYHTNDQSTIGFPYNNTGRTRINGLGEKGISLINTGRDRDLGGVLAAVDTRSATNLRIKWSAGTIQKNERLYAIRLMYRVGTEGPFYDVVHDGRITQYIAGSQDQNFPAVKIPAAALNKPYVQFLWKFYHIAGNEGPRSELWLDDIKIGNMLSDDAFIKEITFKEKTPEYVAIDHEKLVVYAGFEPGTSLVSLTPVITWSELASISPAPGTGGYPAMDFTQPVYFTVSSQSGNFNNAYQVLVNDAVSVPMLKPVELKIYPNPARSHITVSSGSIIRMAELFNISGTAVYREHILHNEHRIDVSHLPAGIYFLRVHTTDGVKAAKVLIQK